MRKNLGFTLVEVLVAVALTGAILLTGYSTFQRIIQAQLSLGATIDIQKNLFYTNEKLAALIRNGGTIDYEEYFNRRILGYTQSVRTDGIYTFTNFSHFGNGENTVGKQPIYYCGYVPPQNEETCLGIDASGHMNTAKDAATFTTSFPIGKNQAYGQYAALAFNYDDPVGYPVPIKIPPIFKTTGGEQIQMFNRGTEVLATQDPLNVGLPELYLIKKNLDNTYTRTYFRHVYVDDSFISTPTCDPTKANTAGNEAANITGCLGKIQMTKLSGCDVGIIDGIIDAWIPLPEFWINRLGRAWSCTNIVPDAAFIYRAAHEEKINPGNHLPNLTWVDVTAPDLNVIRATFLPKPLKIPTLMSGAGDIAQSPSISVYLEVQLSTKLRNKSFVRENVNYPRTLITTYDLSE